MEDRNRAVVRLAGWVLGRGVRLGHREGSVSCWLVLGIQLKCWEPGYYH
jgi:hypothetical protein